mgnify:CR=1 FL=1
METTLVIPLSNGGETLIDWRDLKIAIGHRWYKNDNGYVLSRIGKKLFRLHRFINKTPSGKDTDHINGDRLDNRRVNLRTCTRAENMWNSGRHKDNTSGYKGVSWWKTGGYWQAQISINSQKIHLGFFKSKMDAVKVYDKAVRKYHKEYAKV